MCKRFGEGGLESGGRGLLGFIGGVRCLILRGGVRLVKMEVSWGWGVKVRRLGEVGRGQGRDRVAVRVVLVGVG